MVLAALGAVLALGWYLYSNTVANLAARNIATGFAFLWRESGFEIGESAFLRYSASDSYLRALVVGLTNTLAIAMVGIVLATGLVVGFGGPTDAHAALPHHARGRWRPAPPPWSAAEQGRPPAR